MGSLPSLTQETVGLAGTFRALQHRDFRLYWLALSVSLLGASFQTVAQAWLVYRLTGSPLMLGVVGFLPGILAVPSTLLGGLMADRIPRRKLLIVTQTSMAVPPLVLAYLTWQGDVMVWHVIAAAVLLSLAISVDAPARAAMIPTLVGPGEVTNAQGLGSAARQLSRILGPALAGIAIVTVGEAVCFLINGVSYAVMAGAIGMMSDAPAEIEALTERRPGGLREGLSYLTSTPILLGLFFLLGSQGFFLAPYFTLLPVYAADILSAGAAGLGWLTASAGVGALLGALYVANLRMGRRGRLVLAGSAIAAIALLVFAWSPWFWLSMVSIFALGLGMVAISTTSIAAVLELVPTDLSGRVLSFGTLVVLGGPYAGGMWAGALAEWQGSPLALTAGGVLFIVVTLAVVVRWPELRELK